MIFKLRLDLDCYQRTLLCVTMSLVTSYMVSMFSGTMMGWMSLLLPITLTMAMLKSSLQLEVGDKAVLVTGCDTGFGLALAKHLRGISSLLKFTMVITLSHRSWAHSICWLSAC